MGSQQAKLAMEQCVFLLPLSFFFNSQELLREDLPGRREGEGSYGRGRERIPVPAGIFLK